ncbi:MAG: hypothetical protein JW774_02645, partial [Candidatus Aureabacteria bacterium]|nr:hypothetical protein [Candidatus Auribacterota bacterium]
VGIAHRRDLFNSCSTQLISIFRQYGFKKIAVELDSLDHSQASFHFFWELKQLLMGEGFEVISVDDDYLYVEINLLLRLYGLSLQLAEGREWILTRQEERRQLLSGALAQLNRGVQTYHQTFSAITQQQSESLHQMVGDISEDFASAETVQRLQEISQGLQARLQTAEIRRTCILYQNSVDTDALIAGTGHILQIMAIGNQDSYPGIWLDNTKILRDMFMTSLPRANVLSA